MADRITDLEEQLAESKNLLKKAIQTIQIQEKVMVAQKDHDSD